MAWVKMTQNIFLHLLSSVSYLTLLSLIGNVVSGQARKGRGDEKIGGILETTFAPTTGKIIS